MSNVFSLYLFCFLICVWFIGVLVHEFGHIIAWIIETKKVPALRFNGKNLEVGDRTTWVCLSKFQKKRILLSGVLAGIIFYASLGLISDDMGWVSGVFICYSLWMSRLDLKQLLKMEMDVM